MAAGDKGNSKSSRQDRLAAALRENLKKRKDLTRKRGTAHETDTPSRTPGEPDKNT